MLHNSFSACKLLSNCFVKKLLSGAYIDLAGPYQYFGWYGPGHTGHTASAALGKNILQISLLLEMHAQEHTALRQLDSRPM